MDISNYWDDFAERVALTQDALSNGGMPSLKRLTVHLTQGCNLNCSYCNMCLKKAEMPIQLAKKIIDEFSEMGGSIIHFTGGEPTIVPYFEDVCQYARRAGLQVSSNTNAVKKISVKNIDKLKASFDTCDRDTFNAMVNGEFFDQVVENLKCYSKKMQGKMLSITAVLNRSTYPHMLELAQFCHDNFKLYHLYFSNYKGNDPEFAFTDEEIDDMFSVHIPEVVDFFTRTGQMYSAKQLDLYSKRCFVDGERFPENYTTPCYIQLSELSIDVFGNCFDCSHLYRDGVEGSGFNVATDSLVECFEKAKVALKSGYFFMSEKCLTGCNPNLIGFNKAVQNSILG